jgi:tRNA(Ile)-lysidine synthase
MSNRALAFTAEWLLHILKSFPSVSAYVVAYSGGADSTALLHALLKIKDQLGVPVSAVHINHGIHEDADHWQTLCENFCLQHQVELVTLKIRLEHRQGKGLEAEARHLRYAAITDLLPPGAGLLTAHHADDQAETLLLNLMRGSGVDGLSAMPESRKLGKGVLQRPLLGFQSKALKNYLSAHNVGWTEDPSNQFLNHDRNFVRHEIIPVLEKRWPEVSKRLLLTRKAMTGARHLLEKLADDYLGQNLHHPFVLEMTKQLADDMELFKLVIRRWMTRADTPRCKRPTTDKT